jgi:hypothetical protein
MEKFIEKTLDLSAFFQKFEGLDGKICLVFLGVIVIVSAITIYREYGNLKGKNWISFFF